MSKVTANDILSIARAWLGRNEANNGHLEILNTYNSHQPLARGYKIKPTDEWCDCFVSAVAIKAGAVDIIGTEVGCSKHIEIFKAKGIWIEDGNTVPRPGDIVLFNWDDGTQANDGAADHIGYIEDVKNGVITCIEGNHNRAVSRRVIRAGWGYIRGYARPKYAEPAPKTSTSKSLKDLANEVIAGRWGNGVDRQTRLTAAGYDAAEVQKTVNSMF